MKSPLRQVLVPHLVRLKVPALTRLPIYLKREGLEHVLLMYSHGLPEQITGPVISGFDYDCITIVTDNDLETLESGLEALKGRFQVVVGLGGGKALDVAKFTASRLELPYIAVPTSLSNDGFCSPQASLTRQGRRQSFQARMPAGVVVDLEVVRGAPKALWLSGVGDLVAKWTAVWDWRRAFHHDGTPFDDLAALLSDASVFQFVGHPKRDVRGIRLLAQALLFNGVSMEMAGNSRPASGSEHLISHALDSFSSSPALHGLQVGLATYWMALVQGQEVKILDRLFRETGFWEHLEMHPFSREEWLKALRLAPGIKDGFHTILGDPGALDRAAAVLGQDERLMRCLV